MGVGGGKRERRRSGRAKCTGFKLLLERIWEKTMVSF